MRPFSHTGGEHAHRFARKSRDRNALASQPFKERKERQFGMPNRPAGMWRGDFIMGKNFRNNLPHSTLQNSEINAGGFGMAIVNDHENKRVVDTRNGEYMIFSLHERDSNQWNFNIRDKNDNPLFGSIVEINGHYDNPERTSGEVLYSVIRAWFPSGKPESPKYFFGDTDWIERLKNFLEVYKYYYGLKGADPRFVFADSRPTSGGSQ